MHLWLHDLSKFSSQEAIGYALHDFKNPQDATRVAFEDAWHHHKMNNPHHPEYWLNPNRGGVLEVRPIPMIYLVEMMADWIGAGRTYGKTLEEWLPQNLHHFRFHTLTVIHVTELLKAIGQDVYSDGKTVFSRSVLVC
jgi:hypothetical protein